MSADFSGANFNGVTAHMVMFSAQDGMTLFDQTCMANAKFTMCDLSGLSGDFIQWSVSRFIGCRLNRSHLQHARLEGVVFKACDYRQARIKESQLQSCSFRQSDMDQTRLWHCTLDNIDYPESRTPIVEDSTVDAQ